MRIGVYPLTGASSLQEGPWAHFIAGLEDGGHSVVDARQGVVPADALVVFNRPRSMKRSLGRWRVPRQRRVLIMMEPAVSQPALHSHSYLRLFGSIFAASREWAAKEGAIPFLWPQDISSATVAAPVTADVAMLCANKRSAMPTSLYGLRRGVIRELQAQQGGLALFGSGWNESSVNYLAQAARSVLKTTIAHKAPSLREAFGRVTVTPGTARGFIADKSTGVASAPVSVVIENSPDYVSEKLVDVIRVGRIPVYVGPNLDEYLIPSEVAIVAEPSVRSIMASIRRACSDTGTEAQLLGAEWLASPQAALHESSTVLRGLGRDVGQALRDKS